MQTRYLQRKQIRMSVAGLMAAYVPELGGMMHPTYFVISTILLLALQMICHTLCLLISTTSYKLQPIYRPKSCRDSDVQLLLKYGLTCAAINNPHASFSLQLLVNNLVCADTVGSGLDACQQVYSHSTGNGKNTSFKQDNGTPPIKVTTTGNR